MVEAVSNSLELRIAFVAPEVEAPGLDVRVNFGVVAGREATPAEIDELAHALQPDLPDLTIVSERRHEFGGHSEAELHQVRIVVPRSSLLSNEHEADDVRRLLLSRAEQWARACAERRRANF
jgi:hypothetical protein